MATTQKTATVDVKPATESKINWTQMASLVAMFGAYLGLDIPPEQLVQVILGIGAAVNVLTIILKTYFTGTITPSSVGAS